MAPQALTAAAFEKLPTEEMAESWGDLLRENTGQESRLIYRSGRKVVVDIRYHTPVGWINNRQAYDWETGRRVPVGEGWSADDPVPISEKLRKRFGR